MRTKHQLAITCSAILLSLGFATAQPTLSPPQQATSSLSNQQQEEIEKLIEDEIDRSKKISEMVQSEVDRTFDWTISLINLLITVLIAIPIVTGLAVLLLRRSIIDQLVTETKKQLQEETEHEVKKQLEVQVAAGLKRQVEVFKQELEVLRQELKTLKADFASQLQSLFLAAQTEKEKIFMEISRITPSIIHEEFVAPEVQLKVQELTQQLEALRLANPQLYLTADDYLKQGHALWYEGRYEDAIASYDQAIQINPDLAAAWSGRGKSLDKLKRYEEALASHNQSIQINPDEYKSWFGKGYSLRNMQRYEEALLAYEKVIQLKPDYHHAWNHRGYALLKLGNYQEAWESIEKVAKLQPNSSGLAYNKAYYYALQGKTELAIENLVFENKLKERAKNNSDFDVIRDDERFQQFINR